LPACVAISQQAEGLVYVCESVTGM
ncbi:hypothetical protein E5Q_06788, partial [Mixia osmundae IAM 14324]